MKKILFALIALIGFVACETNDPTVESKLQLSANKSEITANGEDTVTFTVKDMEGAIVEDATIHFADSHEALEGNTFKTKYAGEYLFYAKSGAAKSDAIKITAKEDKGDNPNDDPNDDPNDNPATKELKLTVEPTTIYVDETATFKVELDGNDVTTEATIYLKEGDVALDGATYTATSEGVFEFYAKYEAETSNTASLNVRMKIVEEEKPIEIEATTLTIKANGVDYTKFTVTQNGANVTDSSTIYVNGGVLNGNRFVTTTPGTYTVYAVKGEQKSNELTITAEEVTATGKTIVFAEGVTLTSGWYDVNKVGAGDNGDIQMCWAASASNIIQWWQDRYVAMGGTLPSTAVTGPGKDGTYELALMDMFHEEWDNMYGGFVFHAVPWYFEGKNVCQGWSYQAQPLAGHAGGYFTSAKFTYDKYMDFGYTSDINGYGIWGNGTSLEGIDRLKEFSDIVVESMDRGMASLTISLAENIMSLHHATTLWGYEIDNATGLLTRLWLTDSDDLTSEPKGQILHEFTVSIGEGKSHVKLSCPSIRYQNVWVVGIIPVSGPQL